MTTGNAVDVWKEQEIWSVTANRLKKSIADSRNVVLLFCAVGAFLETLSTQVPAGWPQRVCAGLGAVFLAVIPVITHRMLSSEKTRAWVRARSASEGLKAEAYTFWAKAAPYDGAPDAAAETLRTRTREIREAVEDLSLYAALVQPQNRQPPGPLTPDEYIARRVNEQIDGYYRRKARENAQKARFFGVVDFALAIAAAVMAGLTTALGNVLGLGAWIAVVTTVGGAIAAHVASSRFDFLATSYLATARRLEDLRAQWPPAGGGQVPSPAWSDFVRRCENAISVENESWMAKWIQQDKKADNSGAGVLDAHHTGAT